MVNTNSPGHQAGPGQGSRRGVAGGLGLAVPCRFLTTTTTSGAACAAMLREITRSCAVRGLCVPSNAQVALVAIAIATRTSWNKASHKLKHTPGKSQPTPGKSHWQVGLSTCHSLHGSGDMASSFLSAAPWPCAAPAPATHYLAAHTQCIHEMAAFTRWPGCRSGSIEACSRNLATSTHGLERDAVGSGTKVHAWWIAGSNCSSVIPMRAGRR